MAPSRTTAAATLGTRLALWNSRSRGEQARSRASGRAAALGEVSMGIVSRPGALHEQELAYSGVGWDSTAIGRRLGRVEATGRCALPRTYRRARPGEHRALVVQDAQAFGDSTASVSIDQSLGRTPIEELRVLEEDGASVGLLLARFHRMFWGGRPVAASQLSGLSIGAEHRGRGAASELLRAYLEEAHDRGAGVCTLFPATVPLYRRAGYEYAGTWTLYAAGARHLPHDWPGGYLARPGPADDPAPLQERFARLAPLRNGQVERDTAWWLQDLLADLGHGPPQVFLIDGPDGPDGWAILKLSEQVTGTDVAVTVQVIDWDAATEGGWRSLLALAAGFASLDATVNWKGPEPEPLALLLREQDLHQVRQQRWVLRIVDVPTAFSARGSWRQSTPGRGPGAPTSTDPYWSPSSTSPICTALSAAPLRRLSATDQNSTALASARSARMRPTNTPSVPAHSSGVGYTPAAGSSATVTPGAAARVARKASRSTGASHTARTETACPTMTGTRTHVGWLASSGRPRILRGSSRSLSSSTL